MTAIAKLTDRFTEADIDSEIVIMRLDNGEFFSLSGTSASIWRLIDGSRNREELLAILTDQFDGGETELAGDLDAFLRELRETGLLAA
jgi:hypothetical protein